MDKSHEALNGQINQIDI